MINQLFKSIPDINILYNFLLLINVQKTNQYFYITPYSYKKTKYINCLEPFLNSLKPYYKKSKQHFITRNITYKSLLTIIRQICNANHIYFEYIIKYSNSIYEIHYKIHIKSNIHSIPSV